MLDDTIFPIREFSRLTGLSRETLRFYDKIGLLSPYFRGQNSYRYYSVPQFEFAFLISGLRALGMGLEEIKGYAEARTPERMLALFRAQNSLIETEMERLRAIQTAMRLRTESLEDALRHKAGTVFLEERQREPIFLCPQPEGACTETDAALHAYYYATNHGINIGYPCGSILPGGSIEANLRPSSAQFYFKVREKHNAWKAAGTYAVFQYCPCGDVKAKPYLPLLSFIREKGLRMEGDVYEEYPLDEFSTRRQDDYRIKVEVQVISD